MLKIGVLGAGHLGKIHIKCIKEIKNYELVGFNDPDDSNAVKVEKESGQGIVKKYRTKTYILFESSSGEFLEKFLSKS